MKNGNTECRSVNDIVSYIYEEMDASGRDTFESHLLDCTGCTDELALVSYARLSVFEWQKYEFAPLPTPPIVIPVEAEKAGYFSGLVEIFSFARSLTFVGVGAALLLGFTALAIFIFNSRNEDLVANAVVPAPALGTQAIAALEPSAANVVGVADEKADERRLADIKVVRAVATERRTIRSQRLPSTSFRMNGDVALRETQRSVRKAPALSDFKDEDDDTLRLSDLFAEIGG